jgi:hypothetical protein
MIYKKSVLLICCCKLCCVYCVPTKILMRGYNPLCKDPTCVQPECSQSTENQKVGLSTSLDTPQTVGDNLPCIDPYCNHAVFGTDGLASHTGCTTGCTDFLHTLQNKLDTLLGWILARLHFHGEKCCGHKHSHTHYKQPRSLVHSPDRVPEYLAEESEECLTKNCSNQLAKQARRKKTQSRFPAVKQKPMSNQPTDPQKFSKNESMASSQRNTDSFDMGAVI